MRENRKDRYISFIHNDSSNKHVFLVSSGSLTKAVVSRVHNLPQLYAINIYCSDVTQCRVWVFEFPKVCVICNNDDMYRLP